MSRQLSAQRLHELRTMTYADYLQTAEWRQRRERSLARALWQCEWPGCRTKFGLQVHHKSYEHLGDELDQELAVLCDEHHEGYHRTYGHTEPGPLTNKYAVVVGELAALDRDFDSLADFSGAVKDALVKHHLPNDPASLHRACGYVESLVKCVR